MAPRPREAGARVLVAVGRHGDAGKGDGSGGDSDGDGGGGDGGDGGDGPPLPSRLNQLIDKRGPAPLPRTEAGIGTGVTIARALTGGRAQRLTGRVDPFNVFIARCEARALLWLAGEFDLHEAVDVLQADAVKSGLINTISQDAVQLVMAGAFATVRDDLNGWRP
jgi:hypothetical protein